VSVSQNLPLFRKVLIANRGEIAVRVAKTCRALGISSVAVYSDADADALHTHVCDEAYPIGPAEARHSYLKIEAILAAARAAGADAVHPGYGFLSQNGEFADAVAAAGLTFIGPPGDVHRRMGDKQGARRLMVAAGVPVLPGYDGDDQQDERLLAEGRRIGWPLMLKPSRGGGGKGLRIVHVEAEFLAALQGARREALSAFGDEVMVLERYVERPRHIEVQVLADSQGQIVHLHERECSIQRRHQKVIEETPSPALSSEQRAAVCAAGVTAARAAGYVNAGTVEFLLDPEGRFHFLEMNTRLQVEHAVTEAVTGLDLVRLQLEVAAGRPLPFGQEAVTAHGHALECRVYAEDPSHDDRPSPGKLLLVSAPVGPGVRFDAGVATGSQVSVHYDPMLAKVITWGRDREESIARMQAALRETVVLGVTTNLGRLQTILSHPLFRSGAIHTHFIEAHLTDAEPIGALPEDALAAVIAALQGAPGVSSSQGTLHEAPDPWSDLGAWRLA
jgi:3-methylcrotonyl-CoA carboxylase alpha subunit